MIIKYEFNDGTISEVEVDDELGEYIIASRKEEENYDRKTRYHCLVSLDSLDYEGEIFADPNTPMSIYESGQAIAEQKRLLDYVMNRLSDVQRRRIQMRADGMTLEEISKVEKVSFQSVDIET